MGDIFIPMGEVLEKLRQGHSEEMLLPGLLWRGSVTLLVAESSAGKTTFTHRLAWCLCQKDQSFLALSPPRALQIVHVDLESPPQAKRMLLEVMTPPDGMWLGHEAGISNKALGSALQQTAFDLAIIDNLQLTYPVNDEQDNALAIKQIMWFKSLATAKNAAILLTYNTGKETEERQHRASQLHLARGASSRVDQSDVAVNLVEGEDEEFTLYVAKSRFGNRGEQWRYKWDGEYDYRIIRHVVPSVSRLDHTRDKIIAVLTGGEATISDLEEQIPGTSRRTIYRALDDLITAGKVLKIVPKKYALAQSFS